MLDIKYIRDNADSVQKMAADKGYQVSIAELLKADQYRRDLLVKIDRLRTERKKLADTKSKPSADTITKGKIIKDQIADLEIDLSEAETDYKRLINAIPNTFSPDTPIGPEEAFTVKSEHGKKGTKAIDHLDFATKRDWVDFERGAKVAGTKFYYLKGDLAQLEVALLSYGLEKITKAGFTFMDVPYLVNERISEGTGFAPRSDEQTDSYFIEGEDLALIGTAEVALTGYHADEIIDEKNLPLLYAAYSPCWRKEAGAAGKHTRGLFRVHQFNKLEMYAFCLPENSEEIHQKILAVEEEIWQDLGIPYRVINIPSGDLGAPAWKKYDIEYWSPVDGAYRELTSCSNCTDYQARNLQIRVRRSDGSVEALHTLNGTVIAMGRTLISILENYQKGDKLVVPKVLQKYLGKEEI